MTLEQLEGEDWGEPDYDSHLVTETYRLRRKPLAEFTAEDLRVMIGQQIGLPHLVPLALDLLERDPFVSGDLFAGDLLRNVRRVPDPYWAEHPDQAARLARLPEGPPGDLA